MCCLFLAGFKISNMRFKLLNLLLQSVDFSFGGNQVSFFLSQLGGLVADHPGEAVDVFEMSFHFTVESIGFRS